MEYEQKIDDKKMPKVGELYRSAYLLDKRIWEVRYLTGGRPGFPVPISDMIVTLQRNGRSVPNGAEYLTLPLPVFFEDFEEVPGIEIQKS